MSPKAVQLVKVGQTLQYLGRDNTPFAGLVLMTAETWSADVAASIPELTGTQALVEVTRPKGRKYVRTAVLEGSADHKELIVQESEYAGKMATYEAELAVFQAAQDDTEMADTEGDEPTGPVYPGVKPVIRTYRTI